MKKKNFSPYVISVAEAASLMGISQQYVRIIIRRQLMPFGFCMKTKNTMKYIIPVAQFEEATKIRVPEEMKHKEER